MSKKVLSILSLLVIFAMMLAACGAKEEEAAAGPVTIKVWAPANEVERYRVDGPVKAAESVTDFDITVDPLRDDAGISDFKKKFALAADAGEAPHIVCAGHEDIPVWANAGYILDFEKCRDKYPEFDDVIDSLWTAPTWQDKVWAVPQDTEARPMYYNKTKLEELGWSDADIDALPDKIMKGEFTLDDLIATAKEAIEKVYRYRLVHLARCCHPRGHSVLEWWHLAVGRLGDQLCGR